MARIMKAAISLIETNLSPSSSDEERNEVEPVKDEIGARSDEDLEDVEASPKYFINEENPEEPTYEFGRSKVTSSLIDSYEGLQYFPKGHGRAPGTETSPLPKPKEFVVFGIFSLLVYVFPVIPFWLKF